MKIHFSLLSAVLIVCGALCQQPPIVIVPSYNDHEHSMKNMDEVFSRPFTFDYKPIYIDDEWTEDDNDDNWKFLCLVAAKIPIDKCSHASCAKAPVTSKPELPQSAQSASTSTKTVSTPIDDVD